MIHQKLVRISWLKSFRLSIILLEYFLYYSKLRLSFVKQTILATYRFSYQFVCNVVKHACWSDLSDQSSLIGFTIAGSEIISDKTSGLYSGSFGYFNINFQKPVGGGGNKRFKLYEKLEIFSLIYFNFLTNIQLTWSIPAAALYVSSWICWKILRNDWICFEYDSKFNSKLQQFHIAQHSNFPRSVGIQCESLCTRTYLPVWKFLTRNCSFLIR